MAEKGSLIKTAYVGFTVTAACLSLTAATYAWFSENKIVSTTDKVTARTDEVDIRLLLSQTGGQSFRGSSEAAFVPVGSSDRSKLMPLSTYDLSEFLYSPSTVDGKAVHFIQVAPEKYCYHGRLYIMAQAVNPPEGSRLAVYLDESEEAGGAFIQKQTGYMVNAARLGLTLDGRNPVILSFSDANNPEQYMIENTEINGQRITGSFVLTGEGSSPIVRDDPSVKYTDYVFGDGEQALDAKPLMYLDYNREYVLDMYFYIEGCDPDCSDITQNDELLFHLGFYGVTTDN